MQRQRRVVAKVLSRAHQRHIGCERQALVVVLQVFRDKVGPVHQRRTIRALLDSERDQAGGDARRRGQSRHRRGPQVLQTIMRTAGKIMARVPPIDK